MARIELRDTTIRVKDGLSGSAAINDMAGYMIGDTALTVDTVVTNMDTATEIPVGARLTLAGDETVYAVTAATTMTGVTTAVTVSPPLVAAVVDNAVITILPQQIEVKIGDGNLTYSEHKEYEYELDRGNLDTVREGDEVPMDVNMDFVYEHVTTGTSETISVVDALKRKNGAVSWISTSNDPCEPYCVDVEVEHQPPCGSSEVEMTVFPDFRYDDLDFDLREATISATGRCNATEPIVTRVAA